MVDPFKQLASQPALARQMGAYDRARVEEDLTLTRMVNQYRSLFEETLDRR
jgi:hypothetical protein